MQSDIQKHREWQQGEPCETHPIDCPDGSTHLIRLPCNMWNIARDLVNRRIWDNLEDEIPHCFQKARYWKRKDEPLTIALENTLHAHIMMAFDPTLKPANAAPSYRDLCKG